jgi:hypothetical protein
MKLVNSDQNWGHPKYKSEALPLGPNYILTLNKVSKKKSAQCINATTMKMVKESIIVIHRFIRKIPSTLGTPTCHFTHYRHTNWNN